MSTRMANRVFLNRYEVIRPLGEGGMGRVYLARQLDQDRQVVVKVMHERVARQPKFRETFQREMQFMARFQHPHVVALYDASAQGPEEPCIIMEYVNGIGLDHLLRRHRRLASDRVGRLLGQLCGALQAAHARGIIHRDLKPANVMVVDPDTPHEQIKVMDFGLSKLAAAPHIDLARFAMPDAVLASGTPEYMCPEQVRGDDLDHRGDLYSVGVMLYEMLTGRLPFQGSTTLQLLKAHVEKEPPTFAAVGAGGVPRDVEMLVRLCLAKFPIERPQSARDLAKRYEVALGQRILEDEGLTETSQTMTPKALAALRAGLPAQPVKLDPNSFVHHLEAWLPERIAVVKLNGFVHDVGGEVVESVPGMIRVRLGEPHCVYQLPPRPGPGLLGWLGVGRTPRLIDMQLHLEKPDPMQQQLQVMVLLAPAAGGSEAAQVVLQPEWQSCCDRICTDLRSYLMGK